MICHIIRVSIPRNIRLLRTVRVLCFHEIHVGETVVQRHVTRWPTLLWNELSKNGDISDERVPRCFPQKGDPLGAPPYAQVVLAATAITLRER